MNDKLKMLFVDNPYLAEQVFDFCNSLPEFCQAEQEFQAVSQQVEEKLDQETFNAFDEAQSWYMARLVNAYYLFGLGLRQEVLSALQPEVS